MAKTGIMDGFDFDRVGVKAYDDYNSPKLIVKTLATKVSRVICTDNPDPNSWIKKFWRNEQETKEQEPSD